MPIDINAKIDDRSITVEDFNQFLDECYCEEIPDVVGFNADRIRRRLNPHRKITAKAFGNTVSPDGLNQKRLITPRRGAKGSHVDPTKTARGRRAVSEVKKDLLDNRMVEGYKCNNAIGNTIISKLLASDVPAETKDWLYNAMG